MKTAVRAMICLIPTHTSLKVGNAELWQALLKSIFNPHYFKPYWREMLHRKYEVQDLDAEILSENLADTVTEV